MHNPFLYVHFVSATRKHLSYLDVPMPPPAIPCRSNLFFHGRCGGKGWPFTIQVHWLTRQKLKIHKVSRLSNKHRARRHLPSMMPAANKNTTRYKESAQEYKSRMKTHSLPVQKLDASLANQTTGPLTSSIRPIRPIGFKLDHFASSSGSTSRNSAVILYKTDQA